MKREANFQSTFRSWIRSRKDLESAVFELKQSTTDSIPFDCLAKHQEEALLAAQAPEGILYKAPDDSRSVKPFDFFLVRAMPAFVVVKYPGIFTVITVNAWLRESKASKRRSLTLDRAIAIAKWSVPLSAQRVSAHAVPVKEPAPAEEKPKPRPNRYLKPYA